MQHLVSVSVIGTHDDMTDESLSSAVHQEMSQWFGDKQTADWKLLKVYRVSFAQPNQVRLTHSPNSLTHSLTRSPAVLLAELALLPIYYTCMHGPSNARLPVRTWPQPTKK